MHPRLWALIALCVLLALFILQNVATVEIQFLFWSVAMSRALLMVLLLAIGAAIGWLLHGHLRRRGAHDGHRS
ncbi:MAG: LapA family protein [Pseudomonadales bacterium]|nr:LapA family protein [Pseudomonadales bacterium]